MSNLIAGIDVGTTKVCVLIGELTSDDAIHIVAVGQAPSRGLRRGVVVNISEATAAIGQAVEQAEAAAGHSIGSAFVSVAGSHIASLSSRGVAPVSRGQRGIGQEDISRALDAARAVPIPHNREIIHTLARSWTVDEQQGIRDPIGMHGFRLEVDAHLITGAASSIANLVSCVTAHDIEVDELVLGPLAAGEAVLTPAERDMGVVVADIGGGTTDVALFLENALYHTVVLDVGGNNLTQDVAVMLHAPFKIAEALKVRHGHLQPASLRPDDIVQVSPFGDQGQTSVPRAFLAEVLEARAEEILESLLREVKRSGYDGLLPAGIVLTGGTAQLPGWMEISRQYLQLPVRIGSPRSNISGLREELRSPMYATSVGLLLWGAKQHGGSRPRAAALPWLERVWQWLRNLMPG